MAFLIWKSKYLFFYVLFDYHFCKTVVSQCLEEMQNQQIFLGWAWFSSRWKQVPWCYQVIFGHDIHRCGFNWVTQKGLLIFLFYFLFTFVGDFCVGVLVSQLLPDEKIKILEILATENISLKVNNTLIPSCTRHIWSQGP